MKNRIIDLSNLTPLQLEQVFRAVDKLKKFNTNSTVDDRERRKLLNCSFCKPNRGENAKRKPKSDKYKSKR